MRRHDGDLDLLGFLGFLVTVLLTFCHDIFLVGAARQGRSHYDTVAGASLRSLPWPDVHGGQRCVDSIGAFAAERHFFAIGGNRPPPPRLLAAMEKPAARVNREQDPD